MSTRCSDEGERTVTALFQDARQAEQAYEAALALGYDKSEINLVMSEDTRERLASDPRHAEAAQAADSQVRPKDLGGPIGGAAGCSSDRLRRRWQRLALSPSQEAWSAC